jgi:hypothetical protein
VQLAVYDGFVAKFMVFCMTTCSDVATFLAAVKFSFIYVLKMASYTREQSTCNEEESVLDVEVPCN